MKKVIASLVAVAGLSVAAQGQGLIKFQVSPAGLETWGSTLDAAPGTMFDVRATVSYTGTAAPHGLASMFFQPTVSNWNATAVTGDILGAFANNGAGGNLTTPSGVVLDQPGLYGRISPFGRTALVATNAIKGHTHVGGSGNAPAGSWLRIAQTQIVTWPGTSGNTSGGSGVPIAQNYVTGRVAGEPEFLTTLQNVVIFKYKVTLSADPAVRSLTMDAPALGIGNRSTVTGNGQIYWFGATSEATGQIRGDATVQTASVNIVPTPASLALLGLGGLAIGRRRR